MSTRDDQSAQSANREERETHGRITVRLDDDGRAVVERVTAESEVRINVWRGQGGQAKAEFDVAPSIDVSAFPEFLDDFAQAADLHMDVFFRATRLSSSHVVLEDTGLGLGMALFEMLRGRMMSHGVNGAGSSLKTADDFHKAGVSAAVSVEGRKYVKVVSATTMDDFRWRIGLGKEAFGAVRSEDIDDFIDALAGGMRASFFLHERRVYDQADEFWREATAALGAAISEAFAPNPSRKGLPPGVKATLL